MQLAERMLLAAHELCPGDPATCHELGVVCLRNGMHAVACVWLRNALRLAAQQRTVRHSLQPCVSNILHQLFSCLWGTLDITMTLSFQVVCCGSCACLQALVTRRALVLRLCYSSTRMQGASNVLLDCVVLRNASSSFPPALLPCEQGHTYDKLLCCLLVSRGCLCHRVECSRVCSL
jgi:hypothetical protein